MKLCVGAVSRRVVEEAAKLQVHQIVASRRQVDVGGGYTGYDQSELVRVVNDLSDGHTQVVRDHGGPLQGGSTDDGVDSFSHDIKSGFHALHLDVCMLPYADQRNVLKELIGRFGRYIPIEVGGEHETQDWNDDLLNVALHEGVQPQYVVVGAGTHVWADRQIGSIYHQSAFSNLTRYARAYKIPTKAHNMDFIGNRHAYDGLLDAYNIAPEFGMVEVRAILAVLRPEDAIGLLNYAYDTEAWRRWFHEEGAGTWQDRAECAIRYLLQDPEAQRFMNLDDMQEVYVRGRIRDAINCG